MKQRNVPIKIWNVPGGLGQTLDLPISIEIRALKKGWVTFSICTKYSRVLILKTVPVIFVVNTVLIQYCVYYENYWNSLYTSQYKDSRILNLYLAWLLLIGYNLAQYNPIPFSYPSINSLITYKHLKLRVHQE